MKKCFRRKGPCPAQRDFKCLHDEVGVRWQDSGSMLAFVVALALVAAVGPRPSDGRTATEVTIAGEGKLGLAFAKKRVPLTLKQVAPGSLAAEFVQLVPGMQLLEVGDTAATGLPYADAVTLLR